MTIHPGHFVAIIGGAVSGAEAAQQLAQRGVYVVVFEQKALPYGKIEDGLPKWHEKLRDKEEAKIDEKLAHPYIHFVPHMRLGQELDFEDLVHNWGFSAVLLAVGAWRDRSLPMNGVDAFVNKGLYYQNPMVHWFNHYHEPDYDGPQYELHDDAIVVGGGLASIDVCKILMLELTLEALRERGHEVDMFTLERKGIPKTLDRLGLSFDELGLKGCTLYYRRRDEDMPLVPLPADPTPEDIEKAKPVRQKILAKFQDKYQVQFKGCHMPVDTIVENGRLAGLVFQETEIVDGRVKPLADRLVTVRSPLVVASIGSIPERIPGIPGQGERFKIANWETGQVDGYSHVFALGNAVTGKGNIKESLVHGRQVAEHVAESYLELPETFFQNIHNKVVDRADERVKMIYDILKDEDVLPEETIRGLAERIQGLQQQVGFSDYQTWVDTHRPVRLEELLSQH